MQANTPWEMLPSLHRKAIGTSEWTVYRGRDDHCWPPPAQIRAGATNALGSYLE
jgi:hypothetical protein